MIKADSEFRMVKIEGDGNTIAFELASIICTLLEKEVLNIEELQSLVEFCLDENTRQKFKKNGKDLSEE